MATRAVLTSVLVLRIFTLLALGASVLLMGLNNGNLDDGSKFIFKDVIGYRYVLACGAAGFVYTLIQIPFALYNVAKNMRWIRSGCLQEFDFYGDKVMGLLLASGAGAGFVVSAELKRNPDNRRPKTERLLDRADISTGMLLVGCVSMGLLSIISSNRHRRATPTAKRTFF